MLLAPHKSILKHFLFIAAFSVVAMAPAYFYGVPSGNDQLQHFQFAEAIYDSARSGVAYPSLSSHSNHGFSDAGLRFYPPFAYYVLSFFYFIFGDWFFAAQAAFTLVFFVGGIGIYLWTREEFADEQALVAAAIYAFAPYHINLIYNNFLLGEFFAGAVLPFCLWFLTRVCRNGKWIDAVSLGVSCGLLILTHLPLTIIGAAAMGIYALILLKRRNVVSTLAKLAVSGSLALLLSSFYWVRMVAEIEWVKHSSAKYFADTFDYRNNFLLRPSHFANAGDDVLNLWLADLMLLAILLIVIPSLVYGVRNWGRTSRFVMATLVVLAAAVLMTTPLSDLIWSNLSFLQKVQFPWRWLSIVSIFGAVFASIGVSRTFSVLDAGNRLPLAVGIGVILVFLVFTDTMIVRGAVYIPRQQLNAELAQISSANSCECWWPVWAESGALGQTEMVSTPGRQSTVKEWAATSRRFTVDAGAVTDATIATFYYPLWRAKINSAEVTVGNDDQGRLSVPVPAERSEVELTFQEPRRVSIAYLVAALAWISVVFSLAVLLSRKFGSLVYKHD